MEHKKFKPTKIQIYETSIFENNNNESVLNSSLINKSDINHKTYNYISFSPNENEITDDNINANSYSSSSSYASSLTESNIQVAIDKDGKEAMLSDDDLTNIKKNLVEERRKERYQIKENLLIRKYQLEEEAKLRAIGESKCKRFVKYDCKIGEGGYKVVYKGFDRTDCRDVAWCEVKREHVISKEKRRSMLKEIEIMLKLDHPNVVKCFNVLKNWWTIHDDSVCSKTESKGLVIIQELMNEGTLKGMIKKNFHNGLCILDIHLIAKWWYQILDVLRYMHSRIDPPIIHRDVKSENCFLVLQPDDDCVSVKIGDFGLATTINHNSKRNTMIGTVGFMAPEVYEEKYDSKVDIYAFGIMMLEVMTNKTPYDNCSNVFQIVSKSMGKYLPDVISNIQHPAIKEIIMCCVHPVPYYRPSAEELCEHPIFQNTLVEVEPFFNDLSKSETITRLMDNLNKGNINPIIDLHIKINDDILENRSEYSKFTSIVLSFDIYQSHKADLSDLVKALKSCFEDEIKITPKKINQLDKLITSSRLQIQYLTKTIIGERWRRIFDSYLDKENQKLNDQMNANGNLIDLSHTKYKDESTNNFSEYNFNVSMFHKATKSLNVEIENYCRNCQINKLPRFSTLFVKDNSLKTLTDKNGSKKCISPDLSKISDMHSNNLTNQGTTNPIDSKTVKLKEIEVTTPNKQKRNTVENGHSQYEEQDNIGCTTFQKSSDLLNNPSENEKIIQSPNLTNGNKSTPLSDNVINNVTNNENIASLNDDYPIHFRHLSEPQFIHSSNPNYSVNSILPIGPNLNSGSISTNSETQSYQNIYQPNHPQSKFNQDPNQLLGYVSNFNHQPVIGRKNNLFYQHQSSQHLINYIQSRYLPVQSKLIVSPQNSITGQNYSGIYSGIYYPQSPLVNNNQSPNIMHNNIQYTNPVDHTPRHQTTEPILTRSLPSIIGSPTVSSENVIAPSIMQTSLSSGVSNRMPTISNAPVSNDPASSQRSNFVNNNNVQKPNPILMSTPRPLNTRTQTAISPVPPNSKVQDKSKLKKTKPRIKSKYLLKIIEMSENPGTGEIILVFESHLPMSQMRFSCSLNNEIDSLDPSKFVGDSGQIPGELHKKDILESLVSTVKKIYHSLLEDINSIPLNEEYVFHPCFPNTGLVKFSDCIYQMQISSEIFDAQSSSILSSNPYAYLNSQLVGNNTLTGSCASSRSLSRHASNEDLSWTMSNSLISMTEQPWLPTEIDFINPVSCDNSKIVVAPVDLQKKSMKPNIDTETNRNISITTKCNCNTPSKDCCIKIPEFLFPSVKQIIEKLQNPHTKGLIILPQSNEILLKNLRILEIPTDNMFFGLPCSDSSFNVVKGQKDKDFIIAKDTRHPESAGHSKKCVYQAPTEGAVLLDASGEIQYLQNPSLVIPHEQSKAQIKELPFELTHNKNQLLDCNQIVSVLQSLSTIQNSSDITKDETFDSPVMLAAGNTQCSSVERGEIPDHWFSRRGSGDNNSLPVSQSQNQVQVEYLSFQYVPLQKSTGSKMEMEPGIEISDRDLPRQHVRSRKISNESLEAISTSRNRIPVYVNEIEHLQQQQNVQKLVVNNPMASIQNVQRTVPVCGVLNQMPVQRLPSVAPGHSGQFMLTSQNPPSQMSSNLVMHNLSSVAQYGNQASGNNPAPVVIPQTNNNIPLVLSNQTSMGLNYSSIVPNQVVLSGMLPNQMSQMHIQQPQLSNQRMATPSGMPISSQHCSSMQGLPMQNMINVSQSMMGGSMLPGYSSSLHNSIPTATSEQHFIPVSHPTEFINVNKDQIRQMPPVNIRQMSLGASGYYDPNMSNSFLSDPGMRMRFNQPISSQSQSQSIRFIAYPNVTTTAAQVPVTNINCINQSKLGLSDQSIYAPEKIIDNIAIGNQIQESDSSKAKTEQTIGRFVIRPVTESTEKS